MDSTSFLDVAFRILQGLLMPVIACIAVYIAYQQHKTNRDKLRFNLYDKRLKVFHSLMNFLGDISADGDCSHGRLGQYGAEISESRFLFDKDITDYLEKIYTKAGKLHDLEHEIKNIGALSKERKENIQNKRTEVFFWLFGQITESQTRFEKYLGFKYSANLSEMRPVNSKKGFRRLAFASAIFIAIVCAGLSVVLVLLIHSDAQSNLQWKQKQFKEKYGENEDSINASKNEKPIEEYTNLTSEQRQRLQELLKKRRNFLEDSGAMEAKAELEKLENGFCVNLSKRGLIGVYTLAALLGGIIGFIIVWLTYKLLEWFVLGFCDDEQKQ